MSSTNPTGATDAMEVDPPVQATANAPPTTTVDGNSTNLDASERTAVSAATSTSHNSNNAPKPGANTSTTQQTAAHPESSTTLDPTDQAVLDYLKSKGMGSAVLELQTRLKGNNSNNKEDAASTTTPTRPSSIITPKTPQTTQALKLELEQEDAIARNQRTILTKSTGGGYGYDRDAAVPVVQWGVPDSMPPAAPAVASSSRDHNKDHHKKQQQQPPPLLLTKQLGIQEAQSYLDAFCALQLWVLGLPDDNLGHGNGTTQSVIHKAQALLSSDKTISLHTLVKELTTTTSNNNSNNSNHTHVFSLPPSAKPELLSVAFALLVHTYCELLEVGMETTAHVLRDAFEPIYAPLYAQEFRDLFHCNTTDDMMKLNTHNSQHMEALANLKSILVQVAQLQLKRQELEHAHAQPSHTLQQVPSALAAKKAKLQEYDQTIHLLQQKYTELSSRASQAFDRMHDLPFLRRARAVRWQLTLSTATYGLLSSFLSSSNSSTSLLAMSTLLQTKCELHIERRDPLPFTPACVLDEKTTTTQLNEQAMVNWAAPSISHSTDNTDTTADLPFPKFHLDDEYGDERSAKRDKRAVEFNRAILVNGFRRLQALERKREHEVLPSSPTDPSPQYGLAANPLEPSILLSTLCSNSSNNHNSSNTNSSSGPKTKKHATASTTNTTTGGSTASDTTVTQTPNVDVSTIWEESGIGLTCCKICPPDGRRVAVGCDDAAIRIWDLMNPQGDGSMGEPVQVLLGHKNGFPIFDVDWNRDGRSLLSAGGDGSVRLWDTMAQGPFGTVTRVKPSSVTMTSTKKSSAATEKASNAQAKERLEKATKALEQAKANPDMVVPGLKQEDNPYTSGAALAVYRGHAPNTPVWSVAFAPCGYYFASAGADATARLWTTDRASPVRLFTGHTSKSVNSVVFHPNCNYILTGSEDKTARLWDIQTGRCVRLLTGCGFGINVVKVSPSGQYAAGADYSGIVHLWDLGTGKKVTEFRPSKAESASQQNNKNHHQSMIHSLSFSACGTALATGGDDGCVKVWDVRKTATESKPVCDAPSKKFETRRTMIMDLQHTKRNLLLSMGKYVTAVPALPTPIAD
jgi:WD40 repeat protein